MTKSSRTKGPPGILKKGDEILRRMLNTPPDPKTGKGADEKGSKNDEASKA